MAIKKQNTHIHTKWGNSARKEIASVLSHLSLTRSFSHLFADSENRCRSLWIESTMWMYLFVWQLLSYWWALIVRWLTMHGQLFACHFISIILFSERAECNRSFYTMRSVRMYEAKKKVSVFSAKLSTKKFDVCSFREENKWQKFRKCSSQ